MATLRLTASSPPFHSFSNKAPFVSNEALGFCVSCPKLRSVPCLQQKTTSVGRAPTSWKLPAIADRPTQERLDHGRGTSSVQETQLKTEESHSFDWYSQWYPVAVVDDLDKRVPTAVTIMGRDLVVWWDRHGQAWQVWEDKCPHRLAPLSEGRLNEKGELQCSYHGWCFAGASGSCTRIPQAPLDGAPVWKSKRACALVYPSVEQQGLIWFWPDTRPEFKDVAVQKPPPSIPALEDPTFKGTLQSRNMPYGYEQLLENFMDPAHVPFAHHGLPGANASSSADRNKARPLNLKVDNVEKSGFTGRTELGPTTFIAPCVYTMEFQFNSPKNDGTTTGNAPRRIVMIFICIPVTPGHCKLIWSFPRNFSVWSDPLIPRWITHIQVMLVLDSDMYFLHKGEHNLAEAGGDAAWEKACYVPTRSDAFVIALRKWLKKYSGGAANWEGKYSGLPPTRPKEQVMDRYSSHVMSCRHCKAAMQFLERAGVFLQVMSVAIAAVLGAAAIMPIPQLRSWSIPLVIAAIASSVGSRWLSHFVHKMFRFHDYNHALVK